MNENIKQRRSVFRSMIIFATRSELCFLKLSCWILVSEIITGMEYVIFEWCRWLGTSKLFHLGNVKHQACAIQIHMWINSLLSSENLPNKLYLYWSTIATRDRDWFLSTYTLIGIGYNPNISTKTNYKSYMNQFAKNRLDILPMDLTKI